MVSVQDWPADRPELTGPEALHLVPQYETAQAATRKRINADKRARLDKEHERATDERDGMIWLLDRGFDTDNVIYYSHQERFCFGWRVPYTDAEASALLAVISEFGHAYQIKGESRTWEGY